MMKDESESDPDSDLDSSFILHPSSFILHPSSFIISSRETPLPPDCHVAADVGGGRLGWVPYTPPYRYAGAFGLYRSDGYAALPAVQLAISQRNAAAWPAPGALVS